MGKKENVKKAAASGASGEISDDDMKHLTLDDFHDELDHREFSMFWDSLDLEANWKPILKLFAIRFAMIMT